MDFNRIQDSSKISKTLVVMEEAASKEEKELVYPGELIQS
jgi:hypothetical protein